MSGYRPPRGGGIFGGMLGAGDDFDQPPPAPPRHSKPPKVWGTLAVEGEKVVARVSGWRALASLMSRAEVPLESVVRVVHDPQVRAHVRTKLRKRAGQSGFVRVGPYHSVEGWSFWSVGLARNAVLVETTGARWRFIVIEVEDPKATVAELAAAVSARTGSDPSRSAESSSAT